jgi:hypothetical protein
MSRPNFLLAQINKLLVYKMEIEKKIKKILLYE